MTRILMEGYYGRGNFGDDVLMHVTHQLLRHSAPDATISMVIGDEQEDYPRTMLQELEVIAPDRHARFDRIVHGGGGVFFDFKSYGALYRIAECLVRTIGFKTFVVLERILRKCTGKTRVSGKRIGLGIGIGTFSAGSPRMLRSLPILGEFDALWLRDTQSCEHLVRFKSILKAELVQGSDMAFLTDHWLPPVTRIASTKPKLGIALRDWPGTDIHALRNTLTKLSKHYDITGFIFDEKNDVLLRNVLSSFTTHIWQPRTMRIVDFAARIAAQNVLLTSRAHGAICGACLGVPSVIVNIEPKMEQVHAMLPGATVLVDWEGWQEAIDKALAITPATIEADVVKNRKASEHALAAMKRWLA